MDNHVVRQLKKKGPNPTERQKSAMVEYLKKRPLLISGKFSNNLTPHPFDNFRYQKNEGLLKPVTEILF